MPRVLITSALLTVTTACLRPPSATSLIFPAAQRTSCFGRPARDATIYDTTAVTEKPEIRRWELSYPTIARDRGTGDSVVVSVIVNGDGSVEADSVSFLRHAQSNYGASFDSVALQAAGSAAFWPGCRGASPGVLSRHARLRDRLALPRQGDWGR